MKQFDLCVVVPAHNEARVITQSLRSLTTVIGSEHIYVVSDGSTDATAEIAHSYTPSVLKLKKNVGKAHALEKLIKKFKLFKRYKYILFADADSELSLTFLEAMQEQIKKNPACVVGTVASQRGGPISAYRTYEYGLSHRVYKQAQNIIGSISVAPGCASAYRSDVLSQLSFDGYTLTEDFDLTLQIHVRKLGRIVYAKNARVATQDPNNLADYWKQVLRWYTGFWQNVWLHKMYIPKSKVSLEILLSIVDAAAVIVTIWLLFKYPSYILISFGLFYLFGLILSTTILLLEKSYWAMWYAPIFPGLQIINIAAFFYGIPRAIMGRNKRLAWNKVTRYTSKV